MQFLAGAALLVAASCTDYKSDLDKLDQRLSSVEGTIRTIQDKVKDGSVISNVTPIAGGVKFTIDGKEYEITNGGAGAPGSVVKIGDNGNWFIDGVDTGKPSRGENGSTPTITIGSNGNWFIDGVDSGKSAKGSDGSTPTITIGSNGNWFIDGVDTGKPSTGAGAAGDVIYWDVQEKADGVYLVEIKNGTATGNEKKIAGNAGEGGITAVLTDRVLTLYGVEGIDGGKLSIDLLTKLKGLAFVPEKIFDGLGLITVWEFDYPKNNTTYPFVEKWNDRWTAAGTTRPSVEETEFKDNSEFLATAPTTVTYRMDASNIKLEDYNWKFINRTVYTKASAAGADGTTLVSINKGPVKDGSFVDFEINLNSKVTPADHAKYNDIVALRAIGKADEEPIVSDYAYIDNDVNYGYRIIHKDGYVKTDPKFYRDEFVPIADNAEFEGVATNPKTPVLYYKNTAGIDLLDYVETYAIQLADLVSTKGITPEYKFYFAGYDDVNNKVLIIKDESDPKYNKPEYSPYLSDDTDKTNQNEFVTLNGSNLKVNTQFVSTASPAIGRTPLIYVESLYKGHILAAAFIKVRITGDEIVNPPIPERRYKVFIKHAAEFTIDAIPAGGTYKGSAYLSYAGDNHELNVPWDEMNVKMFNELNMSYEQFIDKYDTDNLQLIVTPAPTMGDPGDLSDGEVKYDPNVTTGLADLNTVYGAGLTINKKSPANWKQNTNIIDLTIDPAVAVGGPHYVYVVYPAKDYTKNVDAVVKFVYNIKPHVHDFVIDNPEWLLNPDYILGTMDKLNFTLPNISRSYAPYDVYGAVRIKGQQAANISGIIEHFKEYYVPAEDAEDNTTFTFEIKNYKNTVVRMVVPAGAPGVIGTSVITGIGTVDNVTLTKAELTDIAGQRRVTPPVPGTGFTPQIEVLDPTQLSNTKDVLVEVTETCTNHGNVKKGYYYVVFEALSAHIDLYDVELGTFREENDYVWAHEVVKVIADASGKSILEWDATADAWALTADTPAGYDATKFEVKIDKIIYSNASAGDTEESFGDRLNLISVGNVPTPVPNTAATETGLDWWNMGTDLQVDKKAEYHVVVNYNGEKLCEKTAKLTVKKTNAKQHAYHNPDGTFDSTHFNDDLTPKP